MLNDSQIATFKEEGYLIIEDLFTEDDLCPVEDEFSAVIEAQAQQLYKAGRVSALYENESFERRLAKITAEAPEAASALQTRAHKDERLFQFMKHPKILDQVESLVGPDILCHPSYNIHPRLPGGYTTPHQDAGFYLPDGDETLILACLIPLVDTTPENGCLWVAPRRHKEGVLRHLWEEDGLNISLEEVSEAERQPVPTKVGSMVMFSSMTPHGSLVNHTDTIRWSMDLRYQALGKPTGRWYVPGFVARNRSNPELETPNCKAWITEVERVEQSANRYPEWPRYRWPQIK